MDTQQLAQLHPALRGYPGVVLELDEAGMVTASNGRLEHALERPLQGHALGAVLEAGSAAVLRELLRTLGEGAEAAPVALRLGGEARSRRFEGARDAASGRVWLFESRPGEGDERERERRQSRESSGLSRALDEVDREARENAALSRALQEQNLELEAQNQELLAMTREVHAGQDQLLQLSHTVERRGRELQVALSARNRFFAAMSHELRTPINAIMGYNDLLLAAVYGPLNEQQELAIERSQRAAQHLRELVNDVLDLSRLEAGRVELELERVNVRELLSELLDSMRPQALAAGCELRLRTEGDAVAVTDVRRLRQILVNLLGNALRLGPGAPVFVQVHPGRGGGVEVEVVDGGPGIAPAEVVRAFEEFAPLPRPAASGEPPVDGSGLGLAIARRLARLLGGDLDASSAPGVGSTFRLTLPAVSRHPAE